MEHYTTPPPSCVSEDVMPARHVHLVGSVPLKDAEDVFVTVSSALGGALKRIPDGETGARSDWITWLEPLFADNPTFELSDDVFRLHEQATPRRRYRLRRGYAPRDVAFANLFYADIATASYATFRRLKE